MPVSNLCRLAGGGITARSPAGGVCVVSGPRRVEGLFGGLPLSLPNRAAARGQGAQRRHQPARATGAAGARGTPARAGGRAAGGGDPRQTGARNARHAHRGAAVPPKGDAGGLPAPTPNEIVSAFPQQGGPLRAQEGAGLGEGEGNRAGRAQDYADPTNQTQRNRQRRAQEARRAPGAERRSNASGASTEQQAKEPGAATARSASAARRTAQQRAAKGRPAQRVAAGASD